MNTSPDCQISGGLRVEEAVVEEEGSYHMDKQSYVAVRSGAKDHQLQRLP